MNRIEGEQNIFIDVDDTLILHKKCKKGDTVVAVTDPYDGQQHYFAVHKAHVKVLKDRKQRGAVIFVWSQNGWEWAEAVVRALNLKEHVNFVLSKPVMHIDDLPCQEWMGPRLYLSPSKKKEL